MTPPRVAIVIPCFNDGGTILEAVRSAQAQEPCEIVVIDDGSTDTDTLATLAQIESEGIQVERLVNGGSPAARMAGVARTETRYVLPLDADDCLEPGVVTILADVLDAQPSLAAAWGDLQLFGLRSHVRVKARQLDPWLVTFINDQPSGALVRRVVLLEVGGWRAPCSGLANCSWDWNFWMALAESGHTGHNVGVVTMRYRVREGVNKSCLAHQTEIYASLRAGHPKLFADRAVTRSRSAVPVAAKLAIRVIDALPGLRIRRRKKLVTIVCHVAFRRGGYLRPLRRRLRPVSRASEAV